MRLVAARNAYFLHKNSAAEKTSENLANEEESMLQQSRFVRFGSGTATETGKACCESFRQKALIAAIHNATPSLVRCEFSSRMKRDHRLREFIQGGGEFQSPESLVCLLQEEDMTRKEEVMTELSSHNLGEEDATDLLSQTSNLARSSDAMLQFVAFGEGCSHDIASSLAKKARKYQLQNRFLSVSDYWRMENLLLCQEFIEGRSSLSCELVSRVTEERIIRQEQVDEVVKTRFHDEEATRL